MVFADIDRIDQVIVNLIDNALKFTPENGTISIWTKTDEEKVLVGVSDTGCGISKEDLDYIFERFFNRITSYNVCYTKLLRILSFATESILL